MKDGGGSQWIHRRFLARKTRVPKAARVLRHGSSDGRYDPATLRRAYHRALSLVVCRCFETVLRTRPRFDRNRKKSLLYSVVVYCVSLFRGGFANKTQVRPLQKNRAWSSP